ncbi:MAG: MFS transporter [Ignavibacteria bacterium]|nr:MFS transporter [Ignavibacteria bacterium]
MEFTSDGKPIHSKEYRRRRILNWLPLGLTYAFLYMARYNLTVSKNALGDLMTKEAFGIIFAAGTITYAFSFLINGPLTDKFGGKKAILASASGSAIMNILMGFILYGILALGWNLNLTLAFSVLYSVNMYFQSFGAVAIVKVNSSWFHVRERGVFGGIFGILISLGLYFAFDWSQAIVNFLDKIFKDKFNELQTLEIFSNVLKYIPFDKFHSLQNLIEQAYQNAALEMPKNPQYWFVFFIPAMILIVWFIIDFIFLRDNPSQAGFKDFNTDDASSGEEETKFKLSDILKRIFTNKVIIVVGLIEFCTGVLRNGVMHWFPIFSKEQIQLTPESAGVWNFWFNNWGLILAIAGASGGMLAGWMSDKFFGSRRAPVAGILYTSILIAVIFMIFNLNSPVVLGILVAVISISVIGTHGMLSGTATMDFGGRKAAGTAVGLIDGLVYLGTGVQSLSLGYITSANWAYWPVFLVPFAIIGILLTIKIWNAFPKGKKELH